jgi:predicted transcriptional regulator
MTDESSRKDDAVALLEVTAKIVAAHISRHPVSEDDLPTLIRKIHQTVSDIAEGTQAGARPTPAVPVKKSVMPDYIVCLEDGKKMKMLKRYLKTVYNMTPEEYREKWGLPADYPMVAPNYAQRRSDLAREIGLGTSASRTRNGDVD